MWPTFVFGLFAFVVCALTLPLVRRAAVYWQVYDQPGALKIHRDPTPRIGGVAMMLGLCACLVPVTLRYPNDYASCFLAFLIVWVVGLIDDVKSLSPLIRLFTHLAAGALLWSGGWRLYWFGGPIANFLLTCLFVAFLINAMNLFDGLDGLVAGTTAIAAIGFLWLSSDSGAFTRIAAWALIGCCLGMLLQNYPPAKVFMGDSGSTLIGILLAFLSLDWIRIQPEVHYLTTPLMFLGLPIADALLAIVRRFRAHQSPLGGDRRHMYDLLMQRGWPVHRVLLVSCAATGFLVVMGWISQGERWQLVAFVVVSTLLWTAHFLGSFRSVPRPSPADQQIALPSLKAIVE